MHNVRMQSQVAGPLQIMVCLFGWLMEQKDVVGLELHDGELLAVCSIAHSKNLLSLYFFRLILILNQLKRHSRSHKFPFISLVVLLLWS